MLQGIKRKKWREIRDFGKKYTYLQKLLEQLIPIHSVHSGPEYEAVHSQIHKEVKKMDRKEFINNFNKFYLQMREENIDVTIQDATMLYAIYRKDLRTRMMNGDKFTNNKTEEMPQGEQSATEKQKCYLMDLAYRNGVCITQRELERITKEQASKTMDVLLGRD